MTGRAAIRAILNRDRVWSVYALGDLAPAHFPHCRWMRAGDGLALLYEAITPPVFFFIGTAQEAATVLSSLDTSAMYLHIQPEILSAVEPRYTVARATPMWRMGLDLRQFCPEQRPAAESLAPRDIEALGRLYADGAETGESPTFFFPSMLEEGVFFGIREEENLIAVAGTHLVNRDDGVAAIGNVYTRRDRRGLGLAGATTSAVLRQLMRVGIATIALNVKQDNPGARRVYERLGFRLHCDFIEGEARR